MWTWLNTRPRTRRDVIVLFLGLLLFNLTWQIAFGEAYNQVFGSPAMQDAPGTGLPPYPAVLLLMPFVALTEEFLRLGLLLLMLMVMERSRFGPVLGPIPVIAICVLNGALFGAAHVSNGLDLGFTLGAQGVGGLLFNLAFVKMGGLSRGKDGNVGAAGLFTTCLHTAFNVIILTLAAWASGTT